MKKVLLKILLDSQENIGAGVSFIMTSQKETLTRVFDGISKFVRSFLKDAFNRVVLGFRKGICQNTSKNLIQNSWKQSPEVFSEKRCS